METPAWTHYIVIVAILLSISGKWHNRMS